MLLEGSMSGGEAFPLRFVRAFFASRGAGDDLARDFGDGVFARLLSPLAPRAFFFAPGEDFGRGFGVGLAAALRRPDVFLAGDLLPLDDGSPPSSSEPSSSEPSSALPPAPGASLSRWIIPRGLPCKIGMFGNSVSSVV